MSNYIDDGNFINPYDVTGLSHSIMASEYKSSKTNPDEFTYQIEGSNLDTVALVSEYGNQIVVNCKGYEEAIELILPKIYYKGYQAVGENGIILQTSIGDNGLLQTTIPQGYVGDITIDFMEPWYWRASEIVTLLCWLGFLVAGIKKYMIRANRTLQEND